MPNITVNIRCLNKRTTGVQRYTSEVIKYFPKEVQQIAPSNVFSNNIALENIWEQLALPLTLKGNLLWSPANIGPILYKNQILTIHDVRPFESNNNNHFSFNNVFAKWYRYALPKLAANVKHIITVSNFSANRIIHNLGVKSNKISVIPCGIDHQKFYKRSEIEIEDFIKKNKLPGKNYILSVSSLLPHKNFRSLLEAWKLISESLPEDIYLVLAGDLPKHGACKIDHMPPRVHYVGHIEDIDLPILYSGAMFFILVSLYEGFGLPILESMACGTPVLASNTTSIPEVMNESGIIINPLSVNDIASNIESLTLDAQLRKQLSIKGLKNAANYDWKITSNKIWQLLSSYT